MIFRKIYTWGILISFVLLGSQVVNCHAGESPWELLHLLQAPIGETPLLHPTALYIDKVSRRYYVVDFGNSRLLAFGETGEYLNSFNGGGKLSHPLDMIKDGSDTLVVLEKESNSLTKILLKEKNITQNHLTYKGKTIIPDRIEMMDDSIIVLEKTSGKIFALNRGFEVIHEFYCPDCPDGFSTFAIAGETIWGLTVSGHDLVQFSLTDNKITKIRLDEIAPLISPVSFDIAENGGIYVLDRFSNEVFVFTPRGTYQYSFLKKGTKAPDLAYPIEIKFDLNGNLCVVDEGNGKVGVYAR